ncbi:zinc-alpha-2-glycoprotein-like isoform X2 [Lithobates pipiens]
MLLSPQLSPGVQLQETIQYRLWILISSKGDKSPILRRMIRVRFLLLCAWAVAGEYAGSHQLHYSFTGISDPVPGLPVFSIVQYLDDQMTTIYSSDTGETRPGVSWMDKGDLKNWEDTLYQHKNWWTMAFKHNIKTAMSRFNQTGGFHVVQLMYGCELRHDNSTRLYYRYGYDGRDFITLDTDRWVFEPGVYEAQISTQRWNTAEDGAGQRWKHILEISCVELLKKYLDYERREPERRVAPEVKILAQESGGITVLHCWVYGFYPREVDVKWMKNGQDVVNLVESTPILRNNDGTYQFRVSMKVNPEDDGAYSCHIDHSSLAEERIVPWDHNRKRIWFIPIVVLLPFLALVTFNVRKIHVSAMAH